jgi:hypothetical protein
MGAHCNEHGSHIGMGEIGIASESLIDRIAVASNACPTKIGLAVRQKGSLAMRKWFSMIAILTPPVLFGALLAQSADTAAQSPPAPTAFNPGVGELMNIIVQPRHTKLWFAGKEANWVLAEYEIKELRSSLANVAKARPVFRERSVAENIEMFMGGAFRAIDDAIRDRNATKFAEAYTTVNAGCNACHTALNQSQVVIKTPEQPSYPDQDFRPQKSSP